VPPPRLSFLQEGAATRAARHRVRAAVLDALAVRAARRLQALAPRAEDRHACLAANAARRAVELALVAGSRRAATAESLEEEAEPDVDEASGRRPPEISARLAELDDILVDVLVPELQAARCEPETSAALEGAMEPRVHLDTKDRRPLGGRVAFFVKVPRETPVIWIDGAPEGLAGPDGWGVVTARSGSVTVCAAPPHGGFCEPSHRARPAMGDAYDLTRPAGDI